MKKLLISIVSFFAVTVFTYGCYSQKLEITGRVVAVERPAKMWPMHYSSVTLFYVKIEKVHKGTIKENYVRLVYPSDRDSFRLVLEDILSPGSRWKFRGGVLEEFDDKINECSRSAEEKNKVVKTQTVKGSESGLPKGDPKSDQEFIMQPLVYGCEASPGLDAEMPALKALTSIDTYWIEDVKKLKAKNEK